MQKWQGLAKKTVRRGKTGGGSASGTAKPQLGAAQNGGERTRPRVLFPAPPPETFSARRSRSHPNVFGEGAEDDTRGRVWSPNAGKMPALRALMKP